MRRKLSSLLDLAARERTLLAQGREIASLRREVASLRSENDRIRAAMRRCVPCEYRREVVERREREASLAASPSAFVSGSERTGEP